MLEDRSTVSALVSPSSSLDRLRSAAIIIPTNNASRYWNRLHTALTLQGVTPDQVLIVDSSSTDDTRELAEAAGYRVVTIPQADFNHGRTRQMAAGLVTWAEFLVYLTQDALPCDADSFSRLLDGFDSPDIGAAYGRQMPRQEADAIESHARLFNYPSVSATRSFDSRTTLGFRAAYFSNSFAAYRRSAFDSVGGFPSDAIVSEEVTVAARMLLSGWKLRYCADAKVIHSHSLTLLTEFSRYFDIAVHHKRECWIIEQFGSVSGEGLNFVRSEIAHLMKVDRSLIPLAIVRNGSKWIAYHLGLKEHLLPLWAKRSISAQPRYWQPSSSREEVLSYEPTFSIDRPSTHRRG